jgi:hypothetical protein
MVDRDAIYREIDRWEVVVRVDPMESFRQVPELAPYFMFRDDGTIDMPFIDQHGRQHCLSLSPQNIGDMARGIGSAFKAYGEWMLNWQRRAEQLDEPPVP